MTKRIFRSISLVSLIVFLVSLVLIMGVLYEYFSQIQQNQLRIQTALAAQGVADEGMDYFDGLDTQDLRITWIDADGTVRTLPIWTTTSNAKKSQPHWKTATVKAPGIQRH